MPMKSRDFDTAVKDGTWAAWRWLFIRNEILAKQDKLTDDAIGAKMSVAFPDRDNKIFQDLRSGDLPRKLFRVQQARSMYNRGGMGKALIKSHRYDGNGNVDDPKFSGKKGVYKPIDQRAVPASEFGPPVVFEAQEIDTVLGDAIGEKLGGD